MRLPRPYIPIPVRLEVALRQAYQAGYFGHGLMFPLSDTRQLKDALHFLFGDESFHLDHDPALENRGIIVDIKTGEFKGYDPDANDPNYLIYRTKENHDTKTRVRGDGAQYSDHALARKNKRIAKNRDPKRRKYKWAKRKLTSRSSHDKRSIGEHQHRANRIPHKPRARSSPRLPQST